MAQPAIKVEGVWKQYTVGAPQHHGTFYDLLTHALKSPFARWDQRRERGARVGVEPESFWALRDVNFEIQPGEVVGIIGRNGTGKSTLLKVLSRITAPSRGRVEIRGRLASLLEVGTGFHPELTGRENVYLNGAILGMGRAEINRKFDDIVEFAELERFIDTPVKRYSSGMYVRLAFAVSAHLDVDVLVVDEVLAVGDAAFQERCLRKMEDVSSSGRTVLFVSHNLGAISRLCSRAVLLNKGEVVCDDVPSVALGRYSKLAQSNPRELASSVVGNLTQKAEILGFKINGSAQHVGEVWRPADEIVFTLTGRLRSPAKQFRVTLCVFKNDQLVLGLHDAERPMDVDACEFESTLKIPSHFLSPGEYTVDVNMYSEGSAEWLLARSLVLFSIATEWADGYEPTKAMGLVNLRAAGTRRTISTPVVLVA